MALVSPGCSGPVVAGGVRPESIWAQSSDWAGVQLLLRSSPPSHIVLPSGQQEHMLYCSTGKGIPVSPPYSQLRTGGKLHKWHQVPHQEVTFLPAGFPFDWQWNYATQSTHLLVEPSHLLCVSEEMEGKRTREFCPQLRIHDPLVSMLLECLRCELTGSGYGVSLADDAMRDILCVHLLKAYGEKKIPPSLPLCGFSHSQKRRLITYIDDHLNENIGLGELAEVAGLSRFHFARQFRQSLGMSPHEYHLHRRIERARELLQHSPEKSVTQIGNLLGFNDESHFGRHFKRSVGTTPGKYRREARK